MNNLEIFVFIVLIGLSLAAKPYTNEEKDKQESIHKKCQSDDATKVNGELIVKLQKGEFIDDPQLKAHLFCMMKACNILKENGDFDIESIKQKWNDHYDADDVAKLEAQCLVKGKTSEDTAFNFIKCQHKIVGTTFGHQHH